MQWKTVFSFIFGIIIWAIVIHVVISFVNYHFQTINPVIVKLDEFFLQKQFKIVLQCPNCYLKIGDIVKYKSNEENNFHPIGEVVEVKPSLVGSGLDVVIWVYPHFCSLLSSKSEFKIYQGISDLDQIINTLLNKKTKDKIQGLLDDFLNNHRKDIEQRLEPLMKSVVVDYMNLIKPDLEMAVNNHQSDITALLKKHYDSNIKAKLIPQLESTAMPQVEQRMFPIVRNLVSSLIDKAPKGLFVWQAFRDQLPWDSRKNLEESAAYWWNTEGTKIFDQYKPKLLSEAESVGNFVINDAKVSEVVKQCLNDFLNDPIFSGILEHILKEAITTNPRTNNFLRERWQKQDMQNAIREIGAEFQPYINSIINSVVLDDNGRINPNFAEVLRSQVLWKDDSWVSIDLIHGEPISNGYRYIVR